MRSGSLEDRAALSAQAQHREAQKALRAERIRLYCARNDDMTNKDAARAFGVHVSVIRAALGKPRSRGKRNYETDSSHR